MNRGNYLKLVAIVLVILAAAAVFYGPLFGALGENLGLDLKGGVSVVLEAKGTADNPVTREKMIQLQEVMRNRVDEMGVTEPVIQPQGENRLIVELPGVKNTEEAVDLLDETAMLEFKDPAGNTVLTGADLKDAKAVFDSQRNLPVVTLEFTPEGAQAFGRATSQNVGRQIAIYLDEKLLSSPVVNEPILQGNAEISGGFSNMDEAANLAALLRGGALPLDVEIIEKHTVGPELGQDSLDKSLIAIAVGLLAIAIYMILLYRVSGVVAVLSLVVYSLIVCAVMVLLNATITLPGIAGLLLSVGMAVDANIIIYERFKDELKTGKTLRAAVDSGFGRAFWTIVDANVTTLIAAGVLYYFGSGPIRGFAVTLSIGIITSMFTAITLTRYILRSVVRVDALKHNWLYGVREKAKELKINFVRNRRIWYVVSLLIIIPGIISLGVQQLNFGIDFTGGNIIKAQAQEPLKSQEMRDFLAGQGLSKFSVRQAEDNQLILRTEELNEQENADLVATMQEHFPGLTLLGNDKVGAVIGRELTSKALYALAIAAVLMVIYISIRFEFWFGLAAIIALLHDVLITLGVFSVFRFEVDSTFVAAVLTLIGYSINDTIVLFDRIRENLKKRQRQSLTEIINTSINATLGRSISTSLTVIFTLVSLLVLGGETTRMFALAMLIGTVSGTYSSIFIASPLWLEMANWRERRSGRKIKL